MSRSRTPGLPSSGYSFQWTYVNPTPSPPLSHPFPTPFPPLPILPPSPSPSSHIPIPHPHRFHPSPPTSLLARKIDRLLSVLLESRSLLHDACFQPQHHCCHTPETTPRPRAKHGLSPTPSSRQNPPPLPPLPRQTPLGRGHLLRIQDLRSGHLLHPTRCRCSRFHRCFLQSARSLSKPPFRCPTSLLPVPNSGPAIRSAQNPHLLPVHSLMRVTCGKVDRGEARPSCRERVGLIIMWSGRVGWSGGTRLGRMWGREFSVMRLRHRLSLVLQWTMCGTESATR